MGLVAVFVIWAGVASAIAALAWARGEYLETLDEIERDSGWHRMWHERIWEDETDERRD